MTDLMAEAEARRLTKCAIEAMTSIAQTWSLTPGERSQLMPGLAEMLCSEDPSMTRTQIDRAAALIGINGALIRRFQDYPERADSWVRQPRSEFGGRAPLEAMIAGGIGAMCEVRRVLEAEIRARSTGAAPCL